ncbi:MAG: hypothetical protein HY544_05280 [Candidatus Diapherotrites archaeon]|uniref:Uncharacterized protein n=1 Tax=Candidatus Iainarchaeum sp. TaxID=3101447 RepID=A0A8T3YLG3_9ARCH|nr:hypothetical protein [Candidatus Diapherotrites archaeon]
MVFLEAVQALLALDAGFFVHIVLSNLFWIMMFYAIIYILYDGKRTVYYFLLLTVYLWAFLDFVHYTGLGWAFAGGAIWIVLRIVVYGSADSIPFLKKYLYQVWTVVAFGILLYVAFFG